MVRLERGSLAYASETLVPAPMPHGMRTMGIVEPIRDDRFV
jgi:hypothetical protein